MKLKDIKSFLNRGEWVRIIDFTKDIEIVYEGYPKAIPDELWGYEIDEISAFNNTLRIDVKRQSR